MLTDKDICRICEAASRAHRGSHGDLHPAAAASPVLRGLPAGQRD